MIVELTLNSERKAARTLIEASDLAFEDKVDVMVGIYENERLVATGSRTGHILKMLPWRRITRAARRSASWLPNW